jgi:hypothetical protein
LYAEDVYISNTRNDTNRNDASNNDTNIYTNRIHFENVILRDFKLYGKYEAAIQLSGVMHLPTISSAKPYYVAASLPSGSNISISISKDGGAEFYLAGNPSQPIRIFEDEKIQLNGVKSKEHSISHVSALMKRPYINATGIATFNSIIAGDVGALPNGAQEVNGTFALRINHIDQNYENIRRGVKMQYVSYFEDFSVKEKQDSAREIPVEIPGDISEISKTGENEVLWQHAMTSNSSLVILITIVAIAALALNGRRRLGASTNYIQRG